MSAMTVLRHMLAILLLPGMVTIVIPYWILSSRPSQQAAWQTADPFSIALALVGIGVIGCGLALMVVTIKQFALVGRGTLAPWDPPKHLVVRGIYRYVRNPMISGVVLILLGESMVFRSFALFEWALTFLVINMIYFPLLEEPMLEQRFGEEYRIFKRNVPRWVPRRTPWTPPWAQETESGSS